MVFNTKDTEDTKDRARKAMTNPMGFAFVSLVSLVVTP
jgi:hypothetical protein